MIIPNNHQIYHFPLNLEDYIQYLLKRISEKIPVKIEHSIEKLSNGIFEGKRDKSLTKYILYLTNNKDIGKYDNYLTTTGFKLKDNFWSITIE